MKNKTVEYCDKCENYHYAEKEYPNLICSNCGNVIIFDFFKEEYESDPLEDLIDEIELRE